MTHKQKCAIQKSCLASCVVMILFLNLFQAPFTMYDVYLKKLQWHVHCEDSAHWLEDSACVTACDYYLVVCRLAVFVLCTAPNITSRFDNFQGLCYNFTVYHVNMPIIMKNIKLILVFNVPEQHISYERCHCEVLRNILNHLEFFNVHPKHSKFFLILPFIVMQPLWLEIKPIAFCSA